MSICLSFGKEHTVHARANEGLGRSTSLSANTGGVSQRNVRERQTCMHALKARKRADLFPKLVPLLKNPVVVGLRHFLLDWRAHRRKSKHMPARVSEGGCRGGIVEHAYRSCGLRRGGPRPTLRRNAFWIPRKHDRLLAVAC